MPQQRLYYEYMDTQLVPYWYVLTFQPCEIIWDKPVFHFTPIPPFEYVERHEFDESLISVTIQLTDFILNPDIPGRIGINLNNVKLRIERHGVDPYVVRQFIMAPPDINEMLTLLPNQRKMSLLVG
ncbi:MAG: hypothetical protein K0R18_538 [Bacillales bacterium]|nr:hypothetical protein [Bacillales bacterium]